MARYCFYCGNALAKGEKCTCRDKSSGSRQTSFGRESNSNDADPTADSKNWAADSKPKKSAARTRKFTSERKKDSQKKSTKEQATFVYQERPRPKRSSKFRSFFDLSALWLGLKQLLSYFVSPYDNIRISTQYADKRKALILLFLEALLGGFLLLSFSGQKYLQALFQLTIVQTRLRSALLNNLFLFFQGFSLVICLHLLLVVMLFFIIKYLAKQSLDFIHLLAALAPVSFYSSIFILMALSILKGSLFHAVLLLCGGFAFTVIVIYFVLKHLCQLHENRIFSLIFLFIIVYVALIALLLSQVFPVLTTLFDMQLSL